MSASDDLVASLSPSALQIVQKMERAGIKTELTEMDDEYSCCMTRGSDVDHAVSFAKTLGLAVARTAGVAQERWPELFASET